MKLLLARHGETDWNVKKRIQGSTDIPLNAVGQQQALELARKLLTTHPDIAAIYSSPLARAIDTAKAVADAFCLPVISRKALSEINFGKWEGLCWDEVQANYPEAFHAWHSDRRYGHPPAGESYHELLLRLVPALQQIIAAQAENTTEILIISHSACIMALLSLLNNTPFHEMVKRYRQENTAVVEIDADIITATRLT